MTTHSQIEAIYEALATAIDKTEAAAGQSATPVYLAKLVLALSHALNDSARVHQLIDQCQEDI
ncbi:hypothetical protein ACFQ3C_14165 [Seohaeicola saemankumensis]|uniref:DUF2783 domain-containing protein n=1 Tax=Seohaeicola saemankumensis TaxID=481181 RepID=A0ABW3TF50_9RHOB